MFTLEQAFCRSVFETDFFYFWFQ